MDEDVDITEKKLFSGDWVVGWIRAGEYLRYTVDVPQEGIETASARASLLACIMSYTLPTELIVSADPYLRVC